MNASTTVKNKIKEYEGLRLTAYRCPAGILTIGYGHTGPDVTPGKTITQAQADSLLDKDIERFERQLNATIGTVNLRQCQYDALLSFAYNVGISNLSSSTLLRKVKSNPDNPAIRDEFARWIYTKGKPLPGLVRRRKWEADHYFSQS